MEVTVTELMTLLALWFSEGHEEDEYIDTPIRDATPEESKGVNDYIESISVETGVNFFDFVKGG